MNNRVIARRNRSNLPKYIFQLLIFMIFSSPALAQEQLRVDSSPRKEMATGPKGGLTITTEPPGASIFIDGKKIEGTTPLTLENIQAGMYYTIEAKKDISYGKSEWIWVYPDRYTSVNIVMEPPKARLTITTDPTEADVLLDGDPVGTSPMTLHDIPYGEHTLEARLSGYHPSIQKINIKDNDQKTSLELKQRTSITPNSGVTALTINSYPIGADVFIDDEWIGTTPLTENLRYGNHHIKATLNDYEVWERDIPLSGKGTVIYGDLKPTMKYILRKRRIYNFVSLMGLAVAGGGATLAVLYGFSADYYGKQAAASTSEDQKTYYQNQEFISYIYMGVGIGSERTSIGRPRACSGD